MLDSLRTTIFASLGIINLAQEKLKSCIDDLVKRGELTREQGDRVVTLLVDKGKEGSREVSEKLNHEIQALIQRTPFVSRSELQELERRVTALEGRAGTRAAPVDDNGAEPTPGS